MDSTDAKDIYSRLQRLEEHDKESIHLMNKQVTIMKSSFEGLGKHLQNLTKYQNQLDLKMNEFSQKLNSELTKMNIELRAVHLQADLNQLFIYILTALQSVHSHISEYFTIINSLQQHRLHPLIIPPKTLLKTYADITKGNQPTLIDFHFLNQIIEVNFVQHNGDMFIKITLPLLEEEEYILNKAHLLPIRILEHNAILDLEASILLNGTRDNHLITLTNEEFHDFCIKCNSKLYPTVYVCAQKQTKAIGAQRESCLFNLLHDNSQVPKSCKYRIIERSFEFLVKLVRRNAWLFSFQSPHSLLSHCEKITSHKEINGTGILLLNQYCKYILGTVEIPYEGNDEVTLPFHQPEPTPIGDSVFLNKFLNNTLISNRPLTNKTKSITLLKTHQSYDNTLKLNSKAIEDFEAELSQTERDRKTELQNAQTHINSGILFILIALIIMLLLPYFRSNCMRKKNIHAEPSTETENSKNSHSNSIPSKSLNCTSTTPSMSLELKKESSNPDLDTPIIKSIVPTPPPPPHNPNNPQNIPKPQIKVSDIRSLELRPSKSFRIKI